MSADYLAECYKAAEVFMNLPDGKIYADAFLLGDRHAIDAVFDWIADEFPDLWAEYYIDDGDGEGFDLISALDDAFNDLIRDPLQIIIHPIHGLLFG